MVESWARISEILSSRVSLLLKLLLKTIDRHYFEMAQQNHCMYVWNHQYTNWENILCFFFMSCSSIPENIEVGIFISILLKGYENLFSVCYILWNVTFSYFKQLYSYERGKYMIFPWKWKFCWIPPMLCRLPPPIWRITAFDDAWGVSLMCSIAQ